MKHSMFTPEELAELAAFDAMVDASDITIEEFLESRMREREEALEGADQGRKKRLLYLKMYYRENRERILSQKKAFYRKNMEALRERRKRYYNANREQSMAYQRAYRKKKIDQGQGGQNSGKDD